MGPKNDPMRLVRGDITRLRVDAIVNAANESLLGGGGVDGAIHRAAGPGLLQECRALGGCPTGEARLTGGHALPAAHVIHTVGPVYKDGEQGEPALLERAYRSALTLAHQRGLWRVAFPNLSTGVYGYPKAAACRIAVDVVAEFEARDPALEVTFVCFDEDNYALYESRLGSGREVMESYVGCLLGGAVGDALGAPLEFLSGEALVARFGAEGLSGYVEIPGGLGKFTDDTQMTLFTAEGLLRARAPVPSSVMRLRGGTERKLVWDSYLRWLLTQGGMPRGVEAEELLGGWLIKEHGLFERRAPGETCLRALLEGHPGTVSEPINDSKGCGGLMRVAPAGLLHPGRPEAAFTLGCELAALTHGHPSGVLASGHLAAVIASLLVGERLSVAIDEATRLLRRRRGHQECLGAIAAALVAAARARSEGRGATLEDIEALGQGWVAEEALAISVYCVLCHPADLCAGVRAAVHHGGDSDSTGSITGQLLGLLLGEAGIPPRWRSDLLLGDLVRTVGRDLFSASRGRGRAPDPEWWRRYPAE